MRHDDARPRKRRRPPLRRKTVRWSAKEVDALLAGVRVHGVGKWAAILRHSPVFNGVRTSVDLKDKWRNLTSPVRAAALHNRDHPSNSPHPLVDSPTPSAPHHPPRTTADPPAPHLSKSLPEPPPPETPQIDKPSPAQPILPPNPAHQAPMSPVHSQEDVQQSLEDQNMYSPSGPASHHSNFDHSLMSLSNRDSIAAKPLPPNHPQPKSPTKLEPKPLPYPSRHSHLHPLQAPSESSVSPEVLSHPPHPPFTHNPQAILPHSHPHPSLNANQNVPLSQHPSSPQLPMRNLPTQQQVNAIQQFMNQSLYQSAAVFADYWRRVGHDPAAYSMNMSQPGSVPSHLYPYYSARIGSAFPTDDDDDDDDDDDHIIPISPTFSNTFSQRLKKTSDISEQKTTTTQSELHHSIGRTIASKDICRSVDTERTKKRPKAEPIAMDCREGKAVAVNRTAETRENPNGRQEATTSLRGVPNCTIEENVRDDLTETSKDVAGLSGGGIGKQDLLDARHAPDSDAVAAGPVMVANSPLHNGSKPYGETGSNLNATQTTFDPSADIEYFSDERFGTKNQKVDQPDVPDSGEGEVTDHGTMGMAPLSFPGLGVEEQRQFPSSDLA